VRHSTIKDDIKGHLESAQLRELKLEVVDDRGPVKSWFLRRTPGSRVYSCMIISHPEGVTLVGDIAPGDRGLVNARQTFEWFVRRDMDYDYLASKFLERGWCSESAREQIEELIEKCSEERSFIQYARLDDDILERVKEQLEEERDSDHRSREDFTHSVAAIFHNQGIFDADSEIYPSNDYEHWDVVRLVGIQRTFRRLFLEKYEPVNPITGEIKEKTVPKDLDQAAIEARVLAFDRVDKFMGDIKSRLIKEGLIDEAHKDMSDDIHVLRAAKRNGILPTEVTLEQRSEAKRDNFRVLYESDT
jgi:hypothetical protein